MNIKNTILLLTKVPVGVIVTTVLIVTVIAIALGMQSNNIIDNMKLINTMFPEQEFIKQGKYYNAGERENYFIESIIPGSFVNKGNDEFLIVVRRPSDELSHAGGLYNAYMAVFDNKSGKMVSDVKLFSADEGNYQTFDSREITYVFFGGSTTYQGWTTWKGGLWKAGAEWIMKWLQDTENREYYDFWENRAVETDDDGIKILHRKLLPLKEKGQIMPEYTWEYVEKFLWDKESGSFENLQI